MREAIVVACARLLYLPPFSPDFNPIESKVKQVLRRLAPRNAEELLQAAATAFAAISTADCQGFFYTPNTLHDYCKCSRIGKTIRPRVSPGFMRQFYNCFIALSSAAKSWPIVASVSSPMFEMRNVVPLIFP